MNTLCPFTSTFIYSMDFFRLRTLIKIMSSKKRRFLNIVPYTLPFDQISCFCLLLRLHVIVILFHWSEAIIAFLPWSCLIMIKDIHYIDILIIIMHDLFLILRPWIHQNVEDIYCRLKQKWIAFVANLKRLSCHYSGKKRIKDMIETWDSVKYSRVIFDLYIM